ncbi:MAG: hypothetical protein R3E32_17065 [Chitinophagales bacterium]
MKRTIEEIKESGTFRLIDHSITHNQFLYRGSADSGINKDILIEGAEYLSIPIYLTDFKIYKGGFKDEEITFKKFTSRGACNVFVIEENGYKHYVVAHRILIQENDYEALETSIPIKREQPLTSDDIQELANKIKGEIDNKGPQFVIDEYIQTGEWEILE